MQNKKWGLGKGSKSSAEPVAQGGKILSATVLVSGLGYFVDIYDLLLFGIVRVASLRSIGVPEDQFLSVGILLVNLQMAGMLLGGFFWGILGDKRGRVSVLFGSILLYSIANLLNAFVTSVPVYGALRFLAGIGLAGELGAAITLVSETIAKEKRGYGTALVAGIGILGAVCAGIVAEVFDWRTAYVIGGLMGIALLLMRLSLFESGLFLTIKNHEGSAIKRGDLTLLFRNKKRFFKYLRCILVGVPIWFSIGIIVTFSPEIAKELQVSGPISAGSAILFSYLGGAIGNLTSGSLTQIWKSRRKVVLLYIAILFVSTAVTLVLSGMSPRLFYFLAVVMGFGTGYWVVFMTIAAEQFGTNLRATVATTVPNFVRGSVVLLTFFFDFFHKSPFSLSLIQSSVIVGGATLVLALVSLHFMEETFARDLDFHEVDEKASGGHKLGHVA